MNPDTKVLYCLECATPIYLETTSYRTRYKYVIIDPQKGQFDFEEAFVDDDDESEDVFSCDCDKYEQDEVIALIKAGKAGLMTEKEADTLWNNPTEVQQ